MVCVCPLACVHECSECMASNCDRDTYCTMVLPIPWSCASQPRFEAATESGWDDQRAIFSVETIVQSPLCSTCLNFSSNAWVRGDPIEEISLQRFARGYDSWIRHDARIFDRGEVVERARTRLGEDSYRVLTNNCQHFCAWALRNQGRSGLTAWARRSRRSSSSTRPWPG
jgi:hypothetical protein